MRSFKWWGASAGPDGCGISVITARRVNIWFPWLVLVGARALLVVGKARIVLGCLALACPIVATAQVTTLTFEQFNAANLPLPGWAIGAQSNGAVSISPESVEGGSGGSLKGSYPIATGGVYVWAAYDVSRIATRDIYIEFRAKMPAAKQGLKFLKIFGGNAGGNMSNYANTTFAMDYTGSAPGGLTQVSFGDGTGISNDTANVINLSGVYPSWIGRAYGTANVLTPQGRSWAASNWGTSWHHFKVHVKFNSGTTAENEVPDGEYYLEIDGLVYVDAKGLFNRHYSNAPINRIELFGWAQSGSQPFELYYDDVRITTGGFYPATAGPSAPASLTVN